MTKTTHKYFGTDGIRGRVGKPPITPKFILKLGWAVGKVLGNGQNKILIGKDTRLSGYMLESALEAGLSAAGIDIHLLGPIPTPAIAFLTSHLGAQAGIVISASHNPYYDNGIKFFAHDGTKLADSIELQIEAYLTRPLHTIDSAKLGKAIRVEDAKIRYVNFCKSTLPKSFCLKGLKIVLDCANGATYHIAPSLFSDLGADLTLLGTKPNGLNINKDCGSTHLKNLQKTVLEKKADLGIAFDGDGDRVLMVDQRGEIVDGDEILLLLAQHGIKKGYIKGGIVGTTMSNLGLELATKKLGLAFIRTAVGDRYVNEALQQKNWQLGGEPSGHIISRRFAKTGDGIIVALQVLEALQLAKIPLHIAKKSMKKFPQVLINIPTENPTAAMNSSHLKKAIEKAELQLKNRGRLLVRPSGTEPIIRVMVEGCELSAVQSIANKLAETIQVLTK